MARWLKIPEEEWLLELCRIHDDAYFYGGSAYRKFMADMNLAVGIAKRGYIRRAVLFFIGVSIGGTPYIPFSWRWGFHYDYGRGYSK